MTTTLPTLMPQVTEPTGPAGFLRRHGAALGCGALGVLLATSVGVGYHSHTTDARRLARSQATLSATKAGLTSSLAELETVNKDLTHAREVLAICEKGTDVGRLQDTAIDHLVDARTGAGYYTIISELQSATDTLKEINDAVDDAGYDSLDDLYDACTGKDASRV